MVQRAEMAREYFVQGYNCSQALVLAFVDEMGLDRETALRLSSSFGGGMGRMREVCGAVSGMFMVAGIKFGYASPDDMAAKTEHYRLIQEMAEKFKAKNGSIICRELLGGNIQVITHVPEDRTPEYYKKRPCAEFVYNAAEILEELLQD